MTKNDIFDLIRQNALDYLDILEREDNDWLIGFPEGEICGGSVKVKGY